MLARKEHLAIIQNVKSSNLDMIVVMSVTRVCVCVCVCQGTLCSIQTCNLNTLGWSTWAHHITLIVINMIELGTHIYLD